MWTLLFLLQTDDSGCFHPARYCKQWSKFYFRLLKNRLFLMYFQMWLRTKNALGLKDGVMTVLETDSLCLSTKEPLRYGHDLFHSGPLVSVPPSTLKDNFHICSGFSLAVLFSTLLSLLFVSCCLIYMMSYLWEEVILHCTPIHSKWPNEQLLKASQIL